MKRGHVSETVLMWQAAGVCEKVLLREQNVVPAACMNSCVMKQGQNDLNLQCHNVCADLTNRPRYTIQMNQYPLRVHQLASCPCYMRLMCTHEEA